MQAYEQKVDQACEFVRSKLNAIPQVGFLTGTGLGDSTAAFDIEQNLTYKEIPHFPASTVQSHHGILTLAKSARHQILIMQGRFHLYEGYSAPEVTFPIRVMQQLGIKYLIISNASGGLNLDYNEGDVMLIKDHINLTGDNPLIGNNNDKWGPRFPDMTSAYAPELFNVAQCAAKTTGIQLQEGVYVGLKGPSLETPAEMRFLKTIGADAVGFSTIMEVIAANHAGMKVLGLSTITNINDPDHPQTATVQAIIDTARKVAPKLGQMIFQILEELE